MMLGGGSTPHRVDVNVVNDDRTVRGFRVSGLEGECDDAERRLHTAALPPHPSPLPPQPLQAMLRQAIKGESPVSGVGVGVEG